MSKVAILLVTCCKEPSRAEILKKVIVNMLACIPSVRSIDVFDNASTEPGVKELLCQTFDNVYQSDKNVGYWSAISWWLNHLSSDPPEYTYIIESDMIHYAFNKLWDCVQYLDENDDVGSVRLLEYSIKNRHLYNKDCPVEGSRISAWQSHTNKVTNRRVEFAPDSFDVWRTTFLTQLPALNRYNALKSSFDQLTSLKQFSELEFQNFYWKHYQVTGILDGGIFHGELSVDVKNNAAIGSWTPVSMLQKMGYQQTRFASITPEHEYIVSKIT